MLAAPKLTVKVRSAEPLSPSVTLDDAMDTVGPESSEPDAPPTPPPPPPSSSSSVRLAPVTDPTPCPFAAEPVTVTLRSGPAVPSSTAVIVTVSAAFAVSPAAMVMVASAPTV